ncbi:pyridoxal phosphate-dependent aminotransferase [Luteitalea sp.]|uniref:pyridoxal phosphate-dependent aminotransferase n=1 Tax=Luteitalea sp. TaxID=2004800 RepID=UPI000B00918A|nr:pyridoxal phosphate-dependent aminotransferase [Luteitalea sp.]
MPLPRRITDIQPPVIPILGEWIRANPGTISLGQGIVSYGPPPEVLHAVQGFGGQLADHRYGPVEGQADLLAILRDKLTAENGLSLDGRRIVVTSGGNMAFLNAVLAVTDPGDEVILPIPYYFNHEMALTMIGCRAVGVPTTAAYQLDLAALRAAITPRTRAIVTISPNNPTGAVYPEADLRAVNALCAEHGLVHITDEVYEYFTYGGASHYSPGRDPASRPHTISLFSLSKAYGFASWRIGYMVVPDELFDAVNKIQDTNLICPPLVCQAAAAAALRVGQPYCAPHVAALDVVRGEVHETLRGIADLVDAPGTDGAFYVLLRVKTALDAFTLTRRLIERHKVAVVPGSAFGVTDTCALRISFGALDRASVATGMGRLIEGLRAEVA